MRSVKRPVLDLEQVRQDVDAWYALKRQAALVTDQMNGRKSDLKKIVQAHGQTDPSTGSLFLELDEPVGDRKIATLKNQRRATTTTNPDAVERILRAKGLWDEMTHTRTVVEFDPDAIYAGFYDGKLTEDELDQMFPKQISYSFILLDNDGKPVS